MGERCKPGPRIELAAIRDDRPIEIASVHLPSKTRSLFGDFQAPSRVRVVESGFMERAMGIEPMSEAWEALNKILKAIDLAALNFSQR